MSDRQLIFVYNANSGVFNSVADFTHKMLSPSTYNCDLCALTYGNFSMKQEWSDFIKTLPLKAVFLHKDEFLSQYHLADELPSVFYKEGETLKPFLTKERIQSCQSVQNLIELVSSELQGKGLQ